MRNHPQAQLANGYDARLVAQLIALQQSAFPPQMQFKDPEAYYREALTDRRNINLVLRNDRREVTGFLCALPLASVLTELHPWDPELQDAPGILYVDIIQTLPGQRQYSGFMGLVAGICREATGRDYRRIAMHVRASNGLNRLTMKLFTKSWCLRRLDNWFGSGESFDYIEAVPCLHRGR